MGILELVKSIQNRIKDVDFLLLARNLTDPKAFELEESVLAQLRVNSRIQLIESWKSAEASNIYRLSQFTNCKRFSFFSSLSLKVPEDEVKVLYANFQTVCGKGSTGLTLLQFVVLLKTCGSPLSDSVLARIFQVGIIFISF
jgi:hypothetical protein